MVVSSWEQVAESSERNNEERWSFIRGISFPPQARLWLTIQHSAAFKGDYPETCLWWAEGPTVDAGGPALQSCLAHPSWMLAFPEQGASACGHHCSAAAATDRSPGQQAAVWKPTAHLGFPGVKWGPAAGATRRPRIWWWLTMLVFLWKPHSNWGACVWSCLP